MKGAEASAGPDDEAALQRLDALYTRRGEAWWDGFYADRARPCPFFVSAPDESLVRWFGQRSERPDRVLDLGCGHGRNAIWLARQGCEVTAVDYAPAAMDWAREAAAAAGVAVQWHCRSVFELDLEPGACDLVYDSGCFHHLAPHRRAGYVRRVVAALKPGGWFGLVCFRPEGGSGLDDDEAEARGSLGGGLGYTEARLREIWTPALEWQELRPMVAQPEGGDLFGADFLWSLWARRPVA